MWEHWKAGDRKGAVFADRYHSRVIATPRHARNALAYVLNNARRHARQAGHVLEGAWMDPFSSATSTTMLPMAGRASLSGASGQSSGSSGLDGSS